MSVGTSEEGTPVASTCSLSQAGRTGQEATRPKYAEQEIVPLTNQYEAELRKLYPAAIDVLNRTGWPNSIKKRRLFRRPDTLLYFASTTKVVGREEIPPGKRFMFGDYEEDGGAIITPGVTWCSEWYIARGWRAWEKRTTARQWFASWVSHRLPDSAVPPVSSYFGHAAVEKIDFPHSELGARLRDIAQGH